MTQTIDAAPPGTTSTTGGTAARRPWRPAALWGLAGALAGAAVFVLAHDALGDDSYITLGYAKQLALHGHWGMLPDRPAHTATSVLNVWLLAAVTVVVRSPVVATGVVLAGALALAAVWLRGLAGAVGAHRGVTTALGLGLLATSPLLTSTVGLETYLAITLLVGVLRFALGGRWVLAGVLAGALVLARPDMGLFLLPIAAVVPWTGPRPWRSLGVGTGAAVAVALPWPVASWWLLGSALPDSLVAKVGAGAWGGMWLFTDATPAPSCSARARWARSRTSATARSSTSSPTARTPPAGSSSAAPRPRRGSARSSPSTTGTCGCPPSSSRSSR